ncbi:MAG TPA: DUF5661 family protein, partial [Gaiellaceae bacterium]
ELEHGLHDLLTNVTGDDPVVTGKIALAHLNEFPDYYTRLERMEEEAKTREASGFTAREWPIGTLRGLLGPPFVRGACSSSAPCEYVTLTPTASTSAGSANRSSSRS